MKNGFQQCIRPKRLRRLSNLSRLHCIIFSHLATMCSFLGCVRHTFISPSTTQHLTAEVTDAVRDAPNTPHTHTYGTESSGKRPGQRTLAACSLRPQNKRRAPRISNLIVNNTNDFLLVQIVNKTKSADGAVCWNHLKQCERTTWDRAFEPHQEQNEVHGRQLHAS